MTDWDTAAVEAVVLKAVARLARVEERSLDLTASLGMNGLDSAGVVTLADELEERLAIAVDPVELFEHGSLNELVASLLIGAHSPPTAPPAVDTGGRALSTDRQEPIAIVGMACRVPGARSLDDLWSLLADGRSAVSEVPPGRWDVERYWDSDRSAPGATYSRWGGYIEDIEMFDAAFFGMRPDTAARTDPQHRLLLEVAYEALLDAGENPGRLAGSRTGVYVGISANEYARRQATDRFMIDDGLATGNALAVAANRLSYWLDLRGPSMAVDTACSSSLVAVDLAVKAIRAGDVDAAVVGGVNALLDPDLHVALAKAAMLSPTGACKAFDADADGYVRAEGCVVVVLKPLTRAIRDRDRIHALILGSAVTQDGRTAVLTAPNREAQQDVLQRALADAGASPDEVAYVECHGTGTRLGDPIEARAIGAVVGATPRRQPCLIGSLKSNLGHLEAAAGLAGLMKAALVTSKRVVPQTLHVSTPNPAIDFTGLGLQVAVQPAVLADDERRWVVGVSSFGFGGTNAHVVVAPVEAPPAPSAEDRPLVVVASARTETALKPTAARLADHIESLNGIALHDVAHTTTQRRPHLRHRAVGIGSDGPSVAASLRASSALPPGRPPERVAFAFAGQGTQWLGMGRDLLDALPLFRSTLARCDEVLIEACGWTATHMILSATQEQLARTEVVQPLLVALQIAQAAVWRSVGIEPMAVVGHSVGELAALHEAGRLPFETALEVAVLRGAAMADTRGTGRMMALEASVDDAVRWAEQFGLSLAAVNASDATVLAGPEANLASLIEHATAAGVRSTWLPGDYPFHSSEMREAAARVRAAAAHVSSDPGTVDWYSSVAGGAAHDIVVDAGYLGDNVERPVQFAAAVAAMLQDGVDAFIEVSPHPVLARALRRTAGDVDRPALVVPSMVRNQGGLLRLLQSVAEFHRHGAAVRWGRLLGDGAVVSLPPPAWDHQRHWLERPDAAPCSGPLVGERLDVAGTDHTVVWTSDVGLEALPLVAERRIDRGAALTAGWLLAAAIEVATAHFGTGAIELEDVTVAPVPVGERVALQMVLQPRKDGATVGVYARPAGATRWIRFASMSTRPAEAISGDAQVATTAPSATNVDLYALLAAGGIEVGPGARRLDELRIDDNRAYAEVRWRAPRGMAIDPALLDALLDVVAAAAGVAETGARPTHIRQVVVGVAPPVGLGRIVASSGGAALLRSSDEEPTATVDGVAFVQGNGGGGSAVTHHEVWEEMSQPSATQVEGAWLVIGGEDEVSTLVRDLAARGVECRSGAEPSAIAPQWYVDSDHVVYVAPPTRDPLSVDVGVLRQVVDLLHRLWSAEGPPPAVVVVMRSNDATHAALAGLVRTAAWEDPGLTVRLLEVAANATAVDVLASAVAQSELELAVRDGAWFVRRVLEVPTADQGPVVLDPDGCYVVTGGTGAVGTTVAEWLGRSGATKIVLLARTARPARPTTPLPAGVDVEVVSVDLRDCDDVAATIQSIRAQFGPIRGVVHAAGVLVDAPLTVIGPRQLDEALGAKVVGLRNLWAATAPDELDWLVCCSSVAGAVGAPGQAAYAAANAALDAFARAVNAPGTVVRSVAWAPWDGAGMGARATYWDEAVLGRKLDPLDGVRSLNSLLQGTAPCKIVLSRAASTFASIMPAPMRALLTASGVVADAGTVLWTERPPLSERAVAPRTDLEERILRIWEEALHMRGVGVFDVLFDLGGDSVTANRILLEVGRALAVVVPPEVVIDNFCVAVVAEVVEARMVAELEALTDEEAARILRSPDS